MCARESTVHYMIIKHYTIKLLNATETAVITVVVLLCTYMYVLFTTNDNE